MKHSVCVHFREYGFDGLVPMLKRPKPLPSWLGIVTPFQTQVWIATIGSLIISATMLAICTHYLKLSSPNDWSLHFLVALNPLLGTYTYLGPIERARLANVDNTRMWAFNAFLMSYFLSSFVIHAGYEGSLKSHLTAVISPKPIQTLDEFAKSDSYSDIIFVNPELNDLIRSFKNSNITALTDIANNKIIRGRSVPIPKFYLEANKGHALVSAKDLLDFNIKRQLTYRDGTTDMQIVPQFLSGYPRTMHVTRMNRFSKLLNKRLSQWNEAGLFQQTLKWEVFRVKSNPLDHDSESGLHQNGRTNFHQLTMEMYRLLLVLYLVGLSVAFVTFLAEILVNVNDNVQRQSLIHLKHF